MITMFVITLLTIPIKLIAQLPWWTFVIPVLIFGIYITRKKREVPAFPVGFLTGFIIWCGSNLYFDILSNGITMNKIGLLLTVPKIVVIVISGLIGGLLTGLALYTGKSIASQAPISSLYEKEK